MVFKQALETTHERLREFVTDAVLNNQLVLFEPLLAGVVEEGFNLLCNLTKFSFET